MLEGIVIGGFLAGLALLLLKSHKHEHKVYRKDADGKRRYFDKQDVTEMYQYQDVELETILQSLVQKTPIKVGDKEITIPINASVKVEFEQEHHGDELEIKFRW